jgi:hypothetical protein
MSEMWNGMKKIKLLDGVFGNSPGDIVEVEHETIDELYYYDDFDRYVYVLRDREGIEFEYVNCKNEV